MKYIALTNVFRMALILTAVAVLPAPQVHANEWIWIDHIDPGNIKNGGYLDYDNQNAVDVYWGHGMGTMLETRVCANGSCYSDYGEVNPITIDLGLLTGGACAPVITISARDLWGLETSNPIQIYIVNGPLGTECAPEPESCEQEVGGPIDVATGRMRYDTMDLRFGGAFPLVLERQYRSDRTDDGPLGVGWSHSYATRLEVVGNSAKFHDTDGRVIPFGKAGGAYYPNRHARLSLATITGGYRVTDPVSVTTYDFDSTGNLTSIANRDGLTQTLTYSAGLLQTVVGPHGRSLTFAYDANERLDTISANPGGIIVDYTVDNIDATLDSVLDPLGHSETYTYTDPYDSHNLTAVYDALGHLVEEHTYDANDRVDSFHRADDVEKLDIEYVSSTQTNVTEHISMAPLETVTSTYTFDPVQKVVTAINGPACECTGQSESRSFTWDNWLNKLTETDGIGRVTKFEYYTFTDGEPSSSGSAYTRGTVKTITEAFGTADERMTTFHYGSGNTGYHLTQTVRPSVVKPGENTTITYDRDLTTKRVLDETHEGWLMPTDPTSTTYTTAFTYDFGQVATIDGPRTDVTDVTTTTYYSDTAPSVPDRGLPYQRTDAVGNVTTYQSYNVYGQPTIVIDPNDVTTTYAYDAKGRLESTTIGTSPSFTTTRVYDDADRLITIVKPAGNRIAYGYDDANRMLSTTLKDNLSNELERLYSTYDLRSLRLTEEAQQCDVPANPCAAWTTRRSETFTYDGFSRLERIDYPDTGFVLYGYDAAGNLDSHQDEAHTTPNTTYGHDDLNRLETVTQILSGAPGGVIVTTYGYDEHDNPTSVTDAEGNVTTYTPDDFGRTRVVDSVATGITTYTLDPAGNVTGISRSSGRTIGRTYDAANRLTDETAGGEPIKQWYWDKGAFGNGRLSASVRFNNDDKYMREYTYDQRGNVHQFSTAVGSTTHTMVYDYDDNGNETGISLTGPGGVDAAQLFLYDAADRLTQARLDGGVMLMSSATHRPFGPIDSYRVGFEMPMPIVQRTPDERYRLEQLTLSVPGHGVVLDRTYSYLDHLNVTGWTDSRDLTLGYDDLSRLTTASDNLGSAWGYTYDNIGNRLTKTITGSNAENWTYSYLSNGASGNTPLMEEQIDATREMPVIHDLDGNMTELRLDTGGGGSDLVVDMEYTDEMTLEVHTEGAVETTYRYDADGYLARIMRDDGGEFSNAHIVYDYRGRLLGIMHPEGSSELDRVFVYGEGQPIAMLLGTPTEKATVYNIITDHLGTPLLYFRNEQQYTRVWYTPFGEVTDVEDVGGAAPPLDLRFPGQVEFINTVSEWPIYYNVHRWYMPDWGRYSQSDPIGLRGGLNLFNYANANPCRWVDPTGWFSEGQIKGSCRCGGLDPTAIAKEVHEKCMNLSFIIDSAIRDCVQDRCDGTGRIKCKTTGDCESSDPGSVTWGHNPQRHIAGRTIWRSNSAILCKNNATPGGTFPNHRDPGSGHSVSIGNVVIHEWAHSCGWEHGDGGGVPLDPRTN